MSFGVFLGAGLGGVGLALGGFPGTAAALGGLTLVALVLARLAARSPAPAGTDRTPTASRGPEHAVGCTEPEMPAAGGRP